jgi:chorismate dehydratase
LKVKVSTVSYLNTLPFLYGINNSQLLDKIELSLDIPSDCASKLINGEVDLGLIPVAVIPYLENYHILTDYCIGADGAVDTVALYSDVPLEEITNVYLDYQSRTSVQLVKVLANNFWNITPNWIDAKEGYEKMINSTSAGVIIGDRTFELENSFKYKYDLAEAWKSYTGLPFVFACWVSNKELPKDFIEEFNAALKNGVHNIENTLEASNPQSVSKDRLVDYINNKIDYVFDENKKIALAEFQNLLSKNKGVLS